MTKFNKKVDLYISISTIVLALGLAIGLIFHFTGVGFFNYGGDYADYNTVTVNYALADENASFNQDAIEASCEEVFKANGINALSKTFAKTTQGGEITYYFSKSTDYAALKICVAAIKSDLGLNGEDMSGLSTAYANTSSAVRNTGSNLTTCIIAVSVALAVQFIYYLIRYKWTMAVGAFIANVHNLAIYLALLAITRVQISSSVITFAMLTVFMTMIGCAILFDKMRKAIKDEENKKVSANVIGEKVASESVVPLLVLFLTLTVAATLVAILTLLGSFSLASLLMPALCAIICFAVTFYGTALVTPYVYSRFAIISEKTDKS